VRAITQAHAFGTRATGHCSYPLTLVAAGIDSKEHLGAQCTNHDRSTWYDDLIQLYASSGVPVVPTLALFSNAERLRGTPPQVLPELAGMFGRELKQVAASINFRTATWATATDVAHAFDAARKLHRAGVSLGAGTDFELPDGVQYELEALVEASLSPLEAIAAATSVAARIMGASADVGRIAPGLLGDIVILDADPTADIRNTRRIWQVIQGGWLIERPKIVMAGWDSVRSQQ
jgi:imidazolonepropionase-like amidohydrolase